MPGQRNLNHPGLAFGVPEWVMSVSISRVVLAAVCLMWLAGCETTSTNNPFAKPAATADVTGSVTSAGSKRASDTTPDTPPLKPELLGADPNDDLSIGKKYYRQGSYGLAERHFRKAVELHPRDAESWVGLAAAYDQLKRFDLADRAYAQAIKIDRADAGGHEQPGLLLHAARRLPPRPLDAAGGPGQGLRRTRTSPTICGCWTRARARPRASIRSVAADDCDCAAPARA